MADQQPASYYQRELEELRKKFVRPPAIEDLEASIASLRSKSNIWARYGGKIAALRYIRVAEYLELVVKSKSK